MKKFFKRYGGILYIVVASALVVILLALSDEMPRVIRSMSELDARWIWGAILCVATYLLARAATLKYYLWREGSRIGPLQALTVTLTGQFYSAITPSSSGGQPLQVVAMVKMGVPLSIATATVSVKFIGFQSAILLIGGAMWIANAGFIGTQLGPAQWLVALGYLINSLVMLAVILTMRKSRLVDRALRACVRLGGRLRLIRDGEKTQAKAHAALEDYREALKRLVARPLDALVVLGLSCVQIVSYMAIIVCVYHAFGLSGHGMLQLFTVQLLLFITAAFVPLPGAAGAQEGGFYLFFRGMFPDHNIIAAMLCWRFFTYYVLLLTGLLGVILVEVRDMIKRKRLRNDA